MRLFHMCMGLYVSLIVGCGLIPYGATYNEELSKGQPRLFNARATTTDPDKKCGLIEAVPSHPDDVIRVWRNSSQPNARWLTRQELKNDVFIGIAISGGGSRSANFSAAALIELGKLGFLEYVNAISSVSGGSITSAYYGLYGRDSKRWNEAAIKERFRANWQRSGILRWMMPHNLLLTGLTRYDRTDVMASVFDSALFDGKTFAALDHTLPTILINSSQLGPGGCSWVFTSENFNAIGSDLNKFAVSEAVMASGAFPGAFNNVTLKDYAAPDSMSFIHLFDGGPTDNLGVSALLREVDRLEKEAPLRGCFIFVIDAFTDAMVSFDKIGEADSRTFSDFFIDSNALAASDTLLARARRKQFQNLGIINPHWQSYFSPSVQKRGSCAVRVLSLERLKSLSGLDVGSQTRLNGRCQRNRNTAIACAVSSIPTAYKLHLPDTEETATELQDYLFEAARWIVTEDRLPVSDLPDVRYDSITDAFGFAKELSLGSTQLSRYLWKGMNGKVKELLEKPCCPDESENLRRALLQQLILFQKDTSLYTPDRFVEIRLSDRTRSFLAESPVDDNRTRLLNRFLLEDAYPQFIDPQRDAHLFTCTWFKNHGFDPQGCKAQ